MNQQERIEAIIRELRKTAATLSDGKRRDVNNKLDKITLALRKADEPRNCVVDEGPGGQPHFESQAKAVLAYLQEGNTITSLEALRRFGIISFPRRILDIEKMTGKAPNRRRITVQNRSGKNVSVCEYWIDKEA